MADAVTISALITARDNATATLNRVGQASQRLGVSLIKLGAPLAAIGGLSLRTFASFEKSMVRVGAVSQATALELESLTDVAREMGRTTIFTATESAEALAFLAQAGQSASEALESLPAVLQLAAAGQIELAQAADIVTNVMAGMGLEVDDLARANDVLVTAFTSANTNLLQLGQAFKFAGPLASAAGLSMEEVAAALAQMGNAGIQATMAGTALRGIIARTLGPTKAASDIMGTYGLQLLTASGNMRPMVEVVEELERVSISASDVIKLFGLRAGPGMQTLLTQGSDALRELQTEMENAGGIAERISSAQMDTLTGSFAELKAAVESVAIDIGGSLAPAVRALVDELKPILKAIGDWTKSHPKLTLVLVAGSLALVALGGALTVVGILLPGIVTGFGLLATAINAVGISALVAASRVTLVVTAMFAATTAIRTFNAISEDSSAQLSKEGARAFREYKKGAADVSDVFKQELKGTMLEAFDAVNVFNDGMEKSTEVMKQAENETKKLNKAIDELLGGGGGGGVGGAGGGGGLAGIAGAISASLEFIGGRGPGGTADDPFPGRRSLSSRLEVLASKVKDVVVGLGQFTDEMIKNAFAGNELRFAYNTSTGELISFTTNMLIAEEGTNRFTNALTGLAKAQKGLFDPLSTSTGLGPPTGGGDFGRGRSAASLRAQGIPVVSGELVEQLAEMIRAGEIESAKIIGPGPDAGGVIFNAQVFLDGDRVGSAQGHSVQDGG